MQNSDPHVARRLGFDSLDDDLTIVGLAACRNVVTGNLKFTLGGNLQFLGFLLSVSLSWSIRINHTENFFEIFVVNRAPAPWNLVFFSHKPCIKSFLI